MAAPIASSRSWRSSERTSRSPVTGVRARTSSPSTVRCRGKIPSSRPSRQTTRCGTERIGTIVQTVRLPARKLARVGRAARWSPSSDRTSVSRSGLAPRSPASTSTRASSRCICPTCHWSARSTFVSAATPARQRVEPVGERLGAGEPVGRRDESVDVLGEPAGQLDPVAPDVVERQGGAEPGLRVVGHGHAGQHPVEPEPPGVLQVADAERFPVVGVESPSDARLAHPAGHRVEVVVDEAETAADRLGLGEVEHRAGRGAAAGHVEELGRDAQQRVGARQRAVGELDPEPVRRVAALDDVTETERRGDQRRVVLDVRAHHQDVAWLERAFAANRILGAVLEQPEQHLAEHLHLPGRAVAAVHLDRPVGRVEAAALRARGVVAQVGLEPAEQRVGGRQRGRRRDLVVVDGRPEAALQLALVAAERCEQRVPDPAVADVSRARHRAGRGRPAAATGRRWGGAATGAGRDGSPGRGAARSR